MYTILLFWMLTCDTSTHNLGINLRCKQKLCRKYFAIFLFLSWSRWLCHELQKKIIKMKAKLSKIEPNSLSSHIEKTGFKLNNFSDFWAGSECFLVHIAFLRFIHRRIIRTMANSNIDFDKWESNISIFFPIAKLL